MMVHSVYFWLKPELTEEQRATFWAGVNSGKHRPRFTRVTWRRSGITA